MKRLRYYLFGLEIPHFIHCLNILIINALQTNNIIGQLIAIKLEYNNFI